MLKAIYTVCRTRAFKRCSGAGACAPGVGANGVVAANYVNGADWIPASWYLVAVPGRVIHQEQYRMGHCRRGLKTLSANVSCLLSGVPCERGGGHGGHAPVSDPVRGASTRECRYHLHRSSRLRRRV